MFLVLAAQNVAVLVPSHFCGVTQRGEMTVCNLRHITPLSKPTGGVTPGSAVHVSAGVRSLFLLF